MHTERRASALVCGITREVVCEGLHRIMRSEAVAFNSLYLLVRNVVRTTCLVD